MTPSIKSVTCVGCCYSRMKPDSTASDLSFSSSFPMSHTISSILGSHPHGTVLIQHAKGIMALSNECSSRFIQMSEDRLLPRERLLWRAIFETALSQTFGTTHPDLLSWSFSIRNISSNSFQSIENYILEAIQQIRIVSETKWYYPNNFFQNYDEKVQTQLVPLVWTLYEKFKDYDRLLLGYLAFQNAISDCCESLIILDRFFLFGRRL